MSDEKSREFAPIVGSDMVKRMTELGYLPQGTTRFVIDSGPVGGVVKIYWSGFANVNMLSMLIDGWVPEPEACDIDRIKKLVDLEFLKALGLDGKQVGDISVEINMPVAGVAACHLHMFISEEQFRPLIEIAKSNPSALHKTATLTLFNMETAETLEVKPDDPYEENE